jgi:hypothetical protein
MIEITLPVKVVPGSQNTAVVGKLGMRVKIKVQAPPEAGRANQELVRLLADELGISTRQIELVFGDSSPEKLFKLYAADQAEAARIQKVISRWMS